VPWSLIFAMSSSDLGVARRRLARAGLPFVRPLTFGRTAAPCRLRTCRDSDHRVGAGKSGGCVEILTPLRKLNRHWGLVLVVDFTTRWRVLAPIARTVPHIHFPKGEPAGIVKFRIGGELIKPPAPRCRLAPSFKWNIGHRNPVSAPQSPASADISRQRPTGHRQARYTQHKRRIGSSGPRHTKAPLN